MKTPRIVVVGSSNTDMIVKAQRLPASGETVTGGQFAMAAGGKGANQALRRSTWRRGHVRGQGGTGPIGRSGDRELSPRRNHHRRDYPRSEPRYGRSVDLGRRPRREPDFRCFGRQSRIDAAGDRFRRRLHWLGRHFDAPIGRLRWKQFARLRKWRPRLAYWWCSRPGPAPAEPLPNELLKCVTYLTPNETEAERLTGIAVKDECSARRACEVAVGYRRTSCDRHFGGSRSIRGRAMAWS